MIAASKTSLDLLTQLNQICDSLWINCEWEARLATGADRQYGDAPEVLTLRREGREVIRLHASPQLKVVRVAADRAGDEVWRGLREGQEIDSRHLLSIMDRYGNALTSLVLEPDTDASQFLG